MYSCLISLQSFIRSGRYWNIIDVGDCDIPVSFDRSPKFRIATHEESLSPISALKSGFEEIATLTVHKKDGVPIN